MLFLAGARALAALSAACSTLVTASLLQELPVQQVVAEQELRNAWFQSVPHPASPELCAAVLKAAWHPPSHIADQPSVVMVTQGPPLHWARRDAAVSCAALNLTLKPCHLPAALAASLRA